MISLLLVACSPARPPLSTAELVAYVTDEARLAIDVEHSSSAVETYLGVLPPLACASGDGNYVYDGTLAPDGLWTQGSLDLTGSGRSARGGGVIALDLMLTYHDVRVGQTYLNGGPVEVRLANVADLQSQELTWDVELRGTVDINDAKDVDVDGGLYVATPDLTLSTWGTVGGVDIGALALPPL